MPDLSIHLIYVICHINFKWFDFFLQLKDRIRFKVSNILSGLRILQIYIWIITFGCVLFGQRTMTILWFLFTSTTWFDYVYWELVQLIKIDVLGPRVSTPYSIITECAHALAVILIRCILVYWRTMQFCSILRCLLTYITVFVWLISQYVVIYLRCLSFTNCMSRIHGFHLRYVI